MISVIAVHVWRITPLAAVIVMAGMMAIRDIEEASLVDGARFWRRTFEVSVPLTLPVMAVAALFGAIFTFTDMTVVYVLARRADRSPGPRQLGVSPRHLRGDIAQGAAVALFLFPLLLRRGDRHPAGGAADGGPLMFDLVFLRCARSLRSAEFWRSGLRPHSHLLVDRRRRIDQQAGARREPLPPTPAAVPAGPLVTAELTDARAEQLRRYARRHVLGRIGVHLGRRGGPAVRDPFLWSLITAFKQNRDLYNADNNPFIFNDPPVWQHVAFLFNDTPFLTFVRNTLLIGLLVVAITLALALPAAYALARLNRPWSAPMAIGMFLVYLVPRACCSCPVCREWSSSSGCRTRSGRWWSSYPTITTPVSVWLLMGFLKGIPVDIEEQAMVDGYGAGSARSCAR